MKKIYTFFSLVLLLGLTKGLTQEAGHTQAERSIDGNGAISYQIPIVISPGTAGMQPNISLTYNSQAGNGLLGYGWSISGLSVISRSAATWAHDNEIDAVDFDDKDRFILDGERLQVISGTYGADGSEYRTEHESFNKVVAYGTAGVGPEKFKVWTRDGLVMEYGYTVDSRVEAQGKTDVLMWRLNRVEDRNGNYYTIEYLENNSISGSTPKQINYTGNDLAGVSPYASIQFEYSTDRPDKGFNKYIGGSLVQGDSRLTDIKTYYGTSLVRTYTLTYGVTHGTNASILSQIQECGGNGSCYDPITFEWTDTGSDSFQDPEVWSSAYGHNPTQDWNLSEHPRAVADVNGDGRKDVIGFGDKGVYLSLSSSSSFETPKLAIEKFGNDNSAGNWLNKPRMLADVNGDGKADIIGFSGDSVHVALSNGAGFDADSLWLKGLDYDIKQGKFKGELADVDGDGTKDIISFLAGGTYVALSKGKGFAAPSNWIGSFCYDGTAHSSPKMGDVNGDGKQDLIGFCQDGVYVALANSNSFTTPYLWISDFGADQGWIYGKHPIHLSDVNNDNLDDLVGFFDDGVYVATSNGSAFSTSSLWVAAYGFNTALGVYPRHLSDLNGDGREDVLAFGTDSIYVSLAEDGYFRSAEGWIANFGYNDGSLQGTLPPILADATGDGKADVVNFGDDGAEVAVSGGQGFEEATVWVSAFSNSNEWQLTRHPRTMADINADGIPDIVGFGEEGVKISIGTGSGFGEPVLVLQSFGYSDAAGAWRADKHIRTISDLNADGYPDIVGFGNEGVQVALGNGNGFDTPTLWLSEFGYNDAAGTWKIDNVHLRYLADVNGDSYPDIVGIKSTGVNVALSDGSSFQASSVWTTEFSWNFSLYPVQLGDVNGDGMADIVGFASGYTAVSLSNGTDFLPSTNWATDFHYVAGWRTNTNIRLLADINNDGMDDIVGIHASGVRIGLSNGAYFIRSNWLGANHFAYNKGYRVDQHGRTLADVNGDGILDIVGFFNEGVEVSFGSGFSFTNPTYWTDQFGNNEASGNWNEENHIRSVADINGDGSADLVAFGNKGVEVALSEAKGLNAIASINNSGNISNFHYAPLTDSRIYTKGSGAAFPELDVQFPIHVVSEILYSNGIGGFTTVAYTYEAAKMNLRGRGFLGFAKVSSTNRVTGIKNITHYNQSYLYAQTPVMKEETLLVASDQLLNERINILGYQQSYVNKVVRSFIQVSAVKEYDLEGNVLKEHTTTFDYDTYGNRTYRFTQHGDGHWLEERMDYFNNESNWMLGRLQRSELTKQTPGQSLLKNVNDFQYSNDLALLVKEIREPEQVEFRLETSYLHDSFGNRTRINQYGYNGYSLETRSNQYDYDLLGRFVIEQTNPMGHQTTFEVEPIYGNITSTTESNGLTSTSTYDDLGRVQEEKGVDDVTKTYTYEQVKSGNFSYLVKEHKEGSPVATSYFDYLDRRIRTTRTGFDDQLIIEDVHLDEKEQIDRVSDPYFSGATIAWTRYEYDEMGRVVKETLADNTEKNVKYEGLTKVTTNPLGQTLTEAFDLLGQLVSTTDHLGNEVAFEYDSYGRKIKTRDAAGNQILINYDLLGRKTQLDDPDLGIINYQYNQFGELIRKEDAKGQVVTSRYDLLGRVIEQVEPEGTASWTYDVGNKAVGRLSSATSADGYVESYEYDNLGRLAVTSILHSDGMSFETHNTYDDLGRISELKYPSGLTVRNVYDAHGYLMEVKRASDQSLYWKAESKNARGQLLESTLGNGLVTNYSYNQYRGWITNIQTSGIQNLSFEFDPYGNLVSRADNDRNLSETFEYDGLNRLLKSEVLGQSIVLMTYDMLGNITYKSDVGCYLYGEYGAGVHAVTSIKNAEGDTIRDYRYDGSGNMIQSHDIMLDYSSFHMVTSMTRGAYQMTFDYGINRQRLAQRIYRDGAIRLDKRYFGSLYEYERDSANNISHIHYVYADGQAVAVHKTGAVESIRYLHRDHLGSVQSITDEAGNLVEVLSYDAWGMRRNPLTWAADNTASSNLSRGFTGHEHLAFFELIHMGGRVYDPFIGRFTSPDPFIQAYGAGQNLNRYSYVLNNPLSYTDPSGFFFKKIFRAIKRVVKFVVKTVKTVVNVVKSAFSSPQGLLNFGLSVGLAWATGGTSLISSIGQVAKATIIGIGTQAVLMNAGVDPTLASIGSALIGGAYLSSVSNTKIDLNTIARKAASWGIAKGLEKIQGQKLAPWLSVANGLIASYTVNVIAGSPRAGDLQQRKSVPREKGRLTYRSSSDRWPTNAEAYGVDTPNEIISKINFDAAHDIYLQQKWTGGGINGLLLEIERFFGPDADRILGGFSKVPLVGLPAGITRDLLFSHEPGSDIVGRLVTGNLIGLISKQDPMRGFQMDIMMDVTGEHMSSLGEPEQTYRYWLTRPEGLR